MRISGETMIFRKDHESPNGVWYSYATGVSSKKQDGSYANAYMNVMFRKGVVVDNKAKINISDGFLTVREYVDKNGEQKKQIEIMVLEFTPVSGGVAQVGRQQGGFSAITDEDVPF